MIMEEQAGIQARRPIEEILDDLDFRTGRTKLPLVYEAIGRWEEIAPHLLAHLEWVIADSDGYLDEDHDLLPYALVMLAHFREERAHPLMLALFGLPGEMTNDLLGDMQTMGLPCLLLNTCGGSLEGIRALVLNRNANDYVRWAAMEALCLAVVAGLAEREETIRFLAGLLTGEEAEPGSDFWNGVANSLCDLYPDEVMESVRKAYEDGLIHPSAIRFEEFEDTIENGVEAALEKVRRELAWRIPSDIVQLVTWCEEIDDRPGQDTNNPRRNDKKKKTQRKKKKKVAKASRRKNR